jgi:hypothetical protein
VAFPYRQEAPTRIDYNPALFEPLWRAPHRPDPALQSVVASPRYRHRLSLLTLSGTGTRCSIGARCDARPVLFATGTGRVEQLVDTVDGSGPHRDLVFGGGKPAQRRAGCTDAGWRRLGQLAASENDWEFLRANFFGHSATALGPPATESFKLPTLGSRSIDAAR